MNKVFISEAKRTVTGAFQGSLSSKTAIELGSQAIGALTLKESVDEVIMGNVLQAGLGQAPARQAALGAGLSHHVSCTTINKVCGSGMKSIMIGADQIRLGTAKSVIAGGMESMSNAPYLLPTFRKGHRFGHAEIFDHMLLDGLEDTFGPKNKPHRPMGLLAEKLASQEGFSRKEQENFVLKTYENAKKALEGDYFKEEIIPIGDIFHDEPVQKVNPEKFNRLKPAFLENGTITAATASSLTDGASALLLSPTKEKGALAQIAGYTSFSREPDFFTLAPIDAIQKLCHLVGWSLEEVDLFEINEAFAVVPMAAMKYLSIPREKINIHGGACCLGHPIGSSGARIVVTLAHALKRYNLKKGIAAICIGSGEATAIALECMA